MISQPRFVPALTVVTLLGAVAPAAAAQQQQQQPDQLTIGRTIERALAPGESHAYRLPLDSGRFAAGVAVQDGVDLQVLVLGPAGDTIGKFDSPNGTAGPEQFQFTSRKQGEHRVVIAPLPENPSAGRYTLALRMVQPEAKTPAAKVDQLMFARGPKDPGAVIAVVKGGRIIYQKAWGLANLAHGVPFTTATPTNIGSTSKQFTAFGILLLASQGKLSLDDDVRKHLPELPDLGATVTLRHLLTHTSGYREFLNTLLLAGRRLDEGDYIDRGEIVRIVQRQPALQNQPGAEFNYNNTGFALLAMVVERVGGKPFPEWMAENVFRPLGMTHTVIRAKPTQIVVGSAQGYAADGSGWREVEDIGASMGAGGIYTTVGDLALWLSNFRSRKVGAPTFLEQMTTRNVLTSGDTTAYGLGLFVDRWSGLRRFQHGGADAAHRSQLSYFPDLDAGVIVDSNDAAFNADATANQVAAAFFETEVRAARAGAPAAAQPAAVPSKVAVPAEVLEQYLGRYELQEMPGFILTFTRDSTGLVGQATGQPPFHLAATSDSTFTLREVAASVTFHREGGKVTSLTLHQNGNHPARRVGAEEKRNLAEYAGRYYSAELEVQYEIVAEGDSLVVRGSRTEPMPLRPGNGEVFSGGRPLASVTFERNAEGQVTGFRAGNGRTRDVLFTKQ